MRLTLVARREAALRETHRLAAAAARPGAPLEIDVHACDLGDRDALAALVDRLLDSGAPDALVNNAGMSSPVAFEHQAALAGADATLELNLRAPIALTHGLLPGLIASQRGVIVNVSSVAGLVGTPNAPVYSATKWGLTGFSESLRARLAPTGVRVVCVQPGPVSTPGWPHRWLTERPVAGHLLGTNVETVARTIADAVHGRGRRGVAPVLPRTYAPIPLLRGLAPWLLRRLLLRTPRSASTASETTHGASA